MHENYTAAEAKRLKISGKTALIQHTTDLWGVFIAARYFNTITALTLIMDSFPSLLYM